MKITIFGAGYVGLVTAVCFAEMGNSVLCIDVDSAKITDLTQGKCPIHEPGLQELLTTSLAKGRLTFTTDPIAAIAHGDIIFIAVGTPQDEDGSADLRYVLAVATQIAALMNTDKIIVNKSTVPVGTADRVHAVIADGLTQRSMSHHFTVVSNPEFLKEGDAINDFMKPDRIIIGSDDLQAQRIMQTLYAPFNRNHQRVMTMSVRSAELTKYAANAMLATRISFMNELSNIAERMGADIEEVRVGMGADKRIGYDFTYPGCGYGGSCFPKDVTALTAMAQAQHFSPALLQAVAQVNHQQKQRLFAKLQHYFHGELRGKTVALWGLAFKPNTDDMREASSRVLLDALWQHGVNVRAHDPVAMPEAQRIYGERADLLLCDELYDVLVGADVLVIVTEWHQFRSPDFNLIKQRLRAPVIFDGRNLYHPAEVANAGLQYYAIGRGLSEFSQ